MIGFYSPEANELQLAAAKAQMEAQRRGEARQPDMHPTIEGTCKPVNEPLQLESPEKTDIWGVKP